MIKEEIFTKKEKKSFLNINNSERKPALLNETKQTNRFETKRDQASQQIHRVPDSKQTTTNRNPQYEKNDPWKNTHQQINKR